MHHKQLIVFDLDDTLIDSSDVYWRARESFVETLKKENFSSERVVEVFEHVDSMNIQDLGFVPQRYKKSMLETYEQLIKQSSGQINQNTIDKIKCSGDIIIEQLPKPIDGAKELLQWVFHRYNLAILTRGEEQFQIKKMNAAGFSKYFEVLKVARKKDKEAFSKIISEMGYQPESTWIIGDSIKSDINPGIEIGANCILFVYSHPSYYWMQEYGDPATGPFFPIKKLKEAINILNSPESFQKVKCLPNMSQLDLGHGV